VQPAATAGATLPAARKNGKFHYTTITTTNYEKQSFFSPTLLAWLLFLPPVVCLFLSMMAKNLQGNFH